MKPSFLSSVRRFVATAVLRDFASATADRLNGIDVRLDGLAAAQAALSQRLDAQLQQLDALRAEIPAIRQELVERVPDRASLSAFEERMRRLEPSVASGELETDPAAIRDNLLNIRLGELESRILTVLEGPYFDRVAERVRSELAEARGPAEPAGPIS